MPKGIILKMSLLTYGSILSRMPYIFRDKNGPYACQNSKMSLEAIVTSAPLEDLGGKKDRQITMKKIYVVTKN